MTKTMLGDAEVMHGLGPVPLLQRQSAVESRWTRTVPTSRESARKAFRKVRFCPRQTDRQLFSGPVPHPPQRFYVAPPPYTRTRGCAPGGSPIGWAVLLLTSTSRARTRRAPRTARALAVQDGLGAWREGGWVGRRCVWSVGCVFRGSSPASFAFPWCAGRDNDCAHRRVARRFS